MLDCSLQGGQGARCGNWYRQHPSPGSDRALASGPQSGYFCKEWFMGELRVERLLRSGVGAGSTKDTVNGTPA